MLASKSKSGLSEISSNKTMPAATATSRVTKATRTGSTKTDTNPPSTLQRRNSVDSKPAGERRTPKTSVTTPEKPLRASKVSVSEIQAQLDVAQKELKKVNEQLDLVENEKAQAIEGLTIANKLVEEANEKFTDALSAQKKAEERLEIEKSRAVELEQACIEAQKKDEALEMELKKVRDELSIALKAKNAALSQVDDANKIAEANEEEVDRLNALLDSKLESVNEETARMVKELDSEVVSLKRELERARVFERKVMDMEALIEELRITVANAKRAEFDASDLADEWKKKAEILQVRVEETCQSEQSSLESQALLTRQVEEANASLQEALSEIVALQGRVELLETELERHKADVEDSDRLLDEARQEALEMEHTIQVLKSEFQVVEEEKRQALDKQKVADSSTRDVSEERDKLREEVEKYKKTLESLASALHEASTEGRDMQERLLMKQTEAENARARVVELESALENTKESYQLMLDEAKYEIVCLKKAIDRYEMEVKNSKSEWDAKQLNLVSIMKNSEEEINTLKAEMSKTVGSLKGVEHEAQEAKEDGAQMLNKLRQAECNAIIANEVIEDLKAERSALKERLLEKENQLQSIAKENDDLRLLEATAHLKIRELSALLPNAETNNTVKNTVLDNGNEEEEEMLEKVIDLSSEIEAESIDDELDYKMDGGSFDQTNGSSAENTENGSVSPSKQVEQKKKKKALLGKFGGLLKKKNNYTK